MARVRSTEVLYKKIATGLLAGQADWRDDAMRAVRAIAARRADAGWSAATWRLYRASLRWYLAESGFPEAAEWISWARTPMDPAAAQPLRGAQKKLKRLTARDLLLLCGELGGLRSRYAEAAMVWLHAGLLTGLRPVEWRSSRIEGSTLIVRNAKATNGRANGAERRLLLHNFSEPERLVIRRMAEIAAEHSDFGKLYQGVRKTVAIAGARVWPKRIRRPSLYSARHQWAANAKRVYDRRTVAALAGHASEDTATRHYARRAVGEEANLPVPDGAGLAAVRRAARRRTADSALAARQRPDDERRS